MKYIFILLFILGACGTTVKKISQTEDSKEWVNIFNGKNLDGWTPKVSGDSVGVNTLNVFRVENELLRVSYSNYDKLDGRYGHLFYKEPLSKYKLKVEYRFVGEKMPDAPNYCYRNSGVMFHSQSAESMGIDQDFPVSLETQFLGSTDSIQQRTANLCTPGLTIFWNGQMTEDHIIPSTSKNYFGDQWVTVEIVVDGAKSISHVIDGDTVLTCSTPQVGGIFMPENYDVPVGTIIDNGYIALQAEGQPIDFRKIELMKLDDK